MSNVSIDVKDKDGKLVLSRTGYDPTRHPVEGTSPQRYWFPESAISQGALPASGAPYTLEITPADYRQAGETTWPDDSIERFQLEDATQ